MKQDTICSTCIYSHYASLDEGNDDYYICHHPDSPGRIIPTNLGSYWCPNLSRNKINDIRMPDAEPLKQEIKKDRFALIDMR
jgi:hypothetical protein